MSNFPRLLGTLALLALLGCGGGDSATQTESPATPGGLTATELEHGIGPIAPFDLPALDAALATQGEEVFRVKCSACHKMGERYVGPALGDVLATRSPAYVMNMMLNPAEMVERHPEARTMLAHFMTAMPDQHLSEAEARSILEYLRPPADQ